MLVASDAARSGAISLTTRQDITAVLLQRQRGGWTLEALRESEVPAHRWPVVVSFDNLIHASKYLLTSFTMPWERSGEQPLIPVGRRQDDLLRTPA